MKVVIAKSVEEVPLQPIDGKPTLVYWNIVGLARPIRLTLALAGIEDHTDVRIDSFEVWAKAKATMMNDSSNFPFPNLPYYMDDTVTITQSDTILRYLGRKYNLLGVPGQEHIVDMIIDQVKDVDSKMTGLCYQSESTVLASHLVETMIPHDMKRFNHVLEGKDYVTGNVVSIADVKLFNFLLKVELMISDLGITDEKASSWLYDNPNVNSFFERMKQLPNIKSYMEGSYHFDRPMNASMAKNIFN